jgi:hypothetical protein
MEIFGKILPTNTQRNRWNKLSENFVSGAEKKIDAFINNAKYSDKSIWATVEKPILEKKSIEIITHIVNGEN